MGSSVFSTFASFFVALTAVSAVHVPFEKRTKPGGATFSSTPSSYSSIPNIKNVQNAYVNFHQYLFSVQTHIYHLVHNKCNNKRSCGDRSARYWEYRPLVCPTYFASLYNHLLDFSGLTHLGVLVLLMILSSAPKFYTVLVSTTLSVSRGQLELAPLHLELTRLTIKPF